MKMKKYLFFALAAVGMLSSCSSDDVVSSGSDPVDDNSLVPIRIGLGQTITRGTGTVGGFDDTNDNVWNRQLVNIYMLYKDSIGLAIFDPQSGDQSGIYDNAVFYTPSALQTGLATPFDNSIKYYPTQKKFDFWGYRLDDAEILSGPTLGTDSLTVNFKIDGSQDVMLAKAIPSAADTAKLVAAGNAAADRAFSSYAARHDVQPNLVFKHHLTRLTFEVIPGGAGAVSATSPVVIDSIKVIAPNQGKMVIASTGDIRGEKQGIIWEESKDSLVLKERKAGDTQDKDLVKLTSVSLADATVNTPVPVGEALMVAPDAQYDLVIFLHQDVPTQIGSTDKKKIKYSYKDVIKRDAGFQKGTSYKVQITLWGLTDIQITTTLTKWVDGGAAIDLRPEDQEQYIVNYNE